MTSSLSPVASSTSPGSLLLECPICQQSLLTNPQNATATAAAVNEAEDPNRRRPSSTSSRWSTICTPCGHMFHKVCIHEWFRIRRHHDGGNCVRCTCPTCRKLIAYHKLIRVYLPITPQPDQEEDDSSSIINNPSIFPPPPEEARVSVIDAIRRFDDSLRHPGHNDPTTYHDPRIYNDFYSLRGVDFPPMRNDLPPNPPDGVEDHSRVYHRHRSPLTSRPYSTPSRGNIDIIIPSTPPSRILTASPSNPSIPSRGEQNVMDLSCQNEECVELKNAYEILSREFQLQQRKLELEMDVSKMKSIIVAGLQRDIDHLRQVKTGRLPCSRLFWILLLAFICFWITAALGLILYEIF